MKHVNLFALLLMLLVALGTGAVVAQNAGNKPPLRFIDNLKRGEKDVWVVLTTEDYGTYFDAIGPGVSGYRVAIFETKKEAIAAVAGLRLNSSKKLQDVHQADLDSALAANQAVPGVIVDYTVRRERAEAELAELAVQAQTIRREAVFKVIHVDNDYVQLQKYQGGEPIKNKTSIPVSLIRIIEDMR